MIDKKSIKKKIKKALKKNKIKTERDAEKIAKKYITMDEASYEITLTISRLLPRNVKTIIRETNYNHPWFNGQMKNIIYKDEFGRIWNKSAGTIKDGIKIYEVNGHYCIDALGGMMWMSDDSKNYVCEYRTNMKEINNRTNP